MRWLLWTGGLVLLGWGVTIMAMMRSTARRERAWPRREDDPWFS